MPKEGNRSARSRGPSDAYQTTLSKTHSDLASLVRGLYGRVARRLGVDPSYVSRVARGERWSKAIDAELRRQLDKILRSFKYRRGRVPHVTGRKKQSKE
jgi:hypothetical protein